MPFLRHLTITLPLNFGFGWAMFLGVLERLIARGGGSPTGCVCLSAAGGMYGAFLSGSRIFAPLRPG